VSFPTQFQEIFLTYDSPFLFGWVAQFYGIGVVGPVYFGLHYLSAQIANFRALDQRLTNMAYTSTVLPVLVVGFYLPHYISYLSHDFAVRHAGNWIWQLFPIWVSGLQMLLAKTILPDTIPMDRIHAPKRDLSTIRFTVGTFSVLAGAVWLYTLILSPFSPIMLFIPHLNNPQTNWIDCTRNILQYDYIFCWSSAILWLLYLFADFKNAGMVVQSWAKIFSAMALTVVVLGPGATVGLWWLWREDILVTKKHKSAVVKGWDIEGESAERHKKTSG
jgi:hypothetical protein